MRREGEFILIAAVAFHFFAGLVAGSVFAARTLLTLIAIVLVECIGVTMAWGISAGLESLASLIGLQVGYLAGVYARSVLEHIGLAQPSIRARRIP
jgi:hypothetical protein